MELLWRSYVGLDGNAKYLDLKEKSLKISLTDLSKTYEKLMHDKN